MLHRARVGANNHSPIFGFFLKHPLRFPPHPVYDFLVVRLPENARAGDEDIHAGLGDHADVVGFDPAVDFDVHGQAPLVDHVFKPAGLVQTVRDKGLPQKPGLTLMMRTW